MPFVREEATLKHITHTLILQHKYKLKHINMNTNTNTHTNMFVGFGGSMDQFTGFAEDLSGDFTVLSFDSLGFGYSEKPPLSYNQYLWR